MILLLIQLTQLVTKEIHISMPVGQIISEPGYKIKLCDKQDEKVIGKAKKALEIVNSLKPGTFVDQVCIVESITKKGKERGYSGLFIEQQRRIYISREKMVAGPETLWHEFGHALFAKLKKPDQEAWLESFKLASKIYSNRDNFEDAGFFSDYALTDPEEDFCETFAFNVNISNEMKSKTMKVFEKYEISHWQMERLKLNYEIVKRLTGSSL